MIQVLLAKIGVSGFVILSLLVICGLEAYGMKHYYDAYHDSMNSISEQNSKIEQANIEREATQDALLAANKLNNELAKQFGQLRGTINGLPLAQDCPSAMNEVRQAQREVKERW